MASSGSASSKSALKPPAGTPDTATLAAVPDGVKKKGKSDSEPGSIAGALGGTGNSMEVGGGRQKKAEFSYG